MTQLSWKKSSFCQEGEACVHVATGPGTAVKVAGSADPGDAHLTRHHGRLVGVPAGAQGGRHLKSPPRERGGSGGGGGPHATAARGKRSTGRMAR
ncbi:DUF397 domain-containing protein [Streptomyces sp. NPDC006430]|uniref:DUF397 domain-containing protein n=1 Tax=Streptomyces sp. NPDC006430 TaxID=3154299 RepID=UPI0033B94EBB